VTFEELRNDIADTAPLFGQPDPDRAAIHLAALMVHIAHFHQLLEVVADIAALIIPTGFQLARCHLVIADVEQQKRLYRVDFKDTDAFEFILDDIQKQPVQTLNQRQRIKVACHKALPVRVGVKGGVQTHLGLRALLLGEDTGINCRIIG